VLQAKTLAIDFIIQDLVFDSPAVLGGRWTRFGTCARDNRDSRNKDALREEQKKKIKLLQIVDRSSVNWATEYSLTIQTPVGFVFRERPRRFGSLTT
jgi:hypothetical protein